MSEASRILDAIKQGNPLGADQLLPLVHDELRRQAAQRLAGEGPGQMGQRLDSLDTLAQAARIRPDVRLRDEAIAVLALPDLRRGPTWHAFPPGFQSWALDARAPNQGVISIRSTPDDREIRRIVWAPTTVRTVLISPNGRYVARVEDGYTGRPASACTFMDFLLAPGWRDDGYPLGLQEVAESFHLVEVNAHRAVAKLQAQPW